jgi:hypothetical protein
MNSGQDAKSPGHLANTPKRAAQINFGMVAALLSFLLTGGLAFIWFVQLLSR